MKIEDVLNRVDEIDEKLNSKRYQDLIFDNVYKKKYKNTSQKYRLIAKLLNDEFSLYGISEVTIWRLLKIKNKSPELYEEIRKGECKIKSAYERLFPKTSKNSKNTSEPDKNMIIPDELGDNLSKIYAEPEFSDILRIVLKYNDYLKNWKHNFKNKPDVDALIKIGDELYKTRKLIYEIALYYDDE